MRERGKLQPISGVAGVLSLLLSSDGPAWAGGPAIQRNVDLSRTKGLGHSSAFDVQWTPTTPVETFPGFATSLRAVHIIGETDLIPNDVLGLVGRPITPELIKRVEERLGRDLSTPARPVVVRLEPAPGDEAGTLFFSVHHFTASHVVFSGTQIEKNQRVQARLHLQAGTDIDPQRLAFDLYSLNRYPFRHIVVKLAPGAWSGQTDIRVEMTDTKPWSAGGGYKYSGGPHESWRRAYIGGSFGDIAGADSVVSFQLTASANAIARSASHPDFNDATLNYVKPSRDRGIVEASYELTGMTFKASPHTYWIVENDGILGYRYLLTGPDHALGQSDVRLGLDLRHERVQDEVDKSLVMNEAADVNEIYLGYHLARDRKDLSSDFDISLRLSPAIQMPGNTSVHYNEYNASRMKSARYGYINLALDETVGSVADLVWHTQFAGTAASGPLPYYDQIILGGQPSVRGYFLADGSFDDGLTWRNDLRFPVQSGGLKTLSPFLFADIGVGHDDQIKATKTLFSAGFGISPQLSPSTVLNLDIARALRHAAVTRTGAFVIESNLKTTF